MQTTATNSLDNRLEIKFKLVQLCFIVHSFLRFVLEIEASKLFNEALHPQGEAGGGEGPRGLPISPIIAYTRRLCPRGNLFVLFGAFIEVYQRPGIHC